MLQKISFTILATCVCVQISVGQFAYFNNDKSFPFGSSGVNSGFSAPSSLQDPISTVPLNKEKDFQIPVEPSTSFFQAPFPSSGSSSAISSTYETFPIANPSPVEIFVAAFNSTVYASKTLPDIFDLGDLSAEAFSKSMYDYVYACGVDTAHGNPHYVASMVATPIKEGLDTYTLPAMLDIYANAIAKYLFAKGTLNSSNASSLALKYAKIVEESTERNWTKKTPESKFLVLEEGFTDYMKSIDHFSVDTIEDLALYFANEVKRVANKS